MTKVRVLVAGASGYAGRYITRELRANNYPTSILVRSRGKLEFDDPNIRIIEGEATRPESVEGCCRDIDVVISTIGITRQKDGLSYMDVDYQANANLIDEAKRSGVSKFIYLSVLNGEKLRGLKICEAKERLGDYLKASGLDYCIIRPNGFFSDMGDFLRMAERGAVYLFGDGNLKLNPIHGADLAKAVVATISQEEKELPVGGPDMLSQNEIASLALKAYSKPEKIVHLPDWIRKLALWVLRTFTSQRTFGPIEFFMTTMVIEMQAPLNGTKHLEVFFNEEAGKNGD